MDKPVAFSEEPTDFSLVEGGPFFQFLLRTRLLRPPTDLAARRVAVVLLVSWLPLLLFSALSGHAFAGISVPFLYDLGAHVRFLLCMPLFLVADVIVHRLIKPIVRQFLDRGLVAPEDLPRFESIIASAMRLRNGWVVEVLLLAVALFGGYWFKQRYLAMNVATWFAVPVNGQSHYTVAGFWYVFVSLTIFRFLLLRWCFRLFVWYRFLWQVARHIRLRLNPLHPDRAGGLAFLSQSVYAFLPILLAQTIALAGILGNKIWHEGAKLPQFKLEIAVWLIFLLLLVLAPLFCFLVQLAEAKRTGLREYGIVASRYVEEFRRKWIEGHAANDEKLVGTSDIQSLADLANSFEVVRGMRVTPFGRATVLQLAIVLVLPFAPLLLTMIPLEQLIDRAVRVFF